MIEIVVAHYKEDLSWLQSTPCEFKITVYNKFEGDNLLPNVGRESHTYLSHIVNNYDRLSDFTLFVQGDPIAHCKNFLQLLENVNVNSSKYEYVGLSEGLITCDGNGRPHCGKDHLPLAKLYEHIFETTAPEVFVCNAAGQFGVSRDTILRNEKSVYEKALNSHIHDFYPIEAYCMERMWTSMFGFKSDMKRSQIDYTGDSNISFEDYFAHCTSSDGSFINLGILGLEKK